MNPSLRSILIVPALVLLAPVVAQAQATPAANPLDVVPDKMPFDVPYGAPVTLDRAEAALAASVAEAKMKGWKLVCARGRCSRRETRCAHACRHLLRCGALARNATPGDGRACCGRTVEPRLLQLRGVPALR